MSVDTSQQDARLQADVYRLLRIGYDESTLNATPGTATPKANRIIKLFNWLFVVVVLVALPMVWWLGYLDAIDINRIGIVLNFVAGFLVAPELIGVDKITRLENLIESLIRKIASGSITGGSDSIKNIFFNIFLPLLVLSSIIYIYNQSELDKDFVVTLMRAMLVILLYFSAMHRVVGLLNSIKDKGIFIALKSNIEDLMLLLIGVTFMYLIMTTGDDNVVSVAFILRYILMLALVILVLEPISNFVLMALARNGALRKILVYWGVVFFVIGNILQFLSTF